MTTVLAATWRPRGELSRLLQSLLRLRQAYSGIALALPPDIDSGQALLLQDIIGSTPVIPSDWSQGRHAALEKALECSGTHIHYADLDRLLHWVEVHPEEWQQTLKAIGQAECLIIGRTERAWATHPLAVRETERSVNEVFSVLLRRPVDLGGGSRGLSRAAALFLLAYSPPGHAPGTDAEWPILLYRAGFRVDYLAVDGLEWESPDRYRQEAADEGTRRRAAEVYDLELGHWLERAKLALDIIQAGLEAWQRDIPREAEQWRERAREP